MVIVSRVRNLARRTRLPGIFLIALLIGCTEAEPEPPLFLEEEPPSGQLNQPQVVSARINGQQWEVVTVYIRHADTYERLLRQPEGGRADCMPDSADEHILICIYPFPEDSHLEPDSDVFYQWYVEYRNEHEERARIVETNPVSFTLSPGPPFEEISRFYFIPRQLFLHVGQIEHVRLSSVALSQEDQWMHLSSLHDSVATVPDSVRLPAGSGAAEVEVTGTWHGETIVTGRLHGDRVAHMMVRVIELEPPSLVAPGHNATIRIDSHGVLQEVSFKWRVIPGARAYRFQIIADDGRVVIDEPLTDIDSFLTDDGVLEVTAELDQGIYHWYVSAVDGRLAPPEGPRSTRRLAIFADPG